MAESIHNHNTPLSLLSDDAEAFAGIVFAAIASDKYIAPNEIAYLRAVFSRMRLFKGWTDEKYRVMFAKLRDIIDQQGLEALIDISITVLSAKLFQTAFAIAVDLVLSDGIVTKAEKDFLYGLQHKLGIDTELAMKIIDVIMLKNRG